MRVFLSEAGEGADGATGAILAGSSSQSEESIHLGDDVCADFFQVWESLVEFS